MRSTISDPSTGELSWCSALHTATKTTQYLLYLLYLSLSVTVLPLPSTRHKMKTEVFLVKYKTFIIDEKM